MADYKRLVSYIYAYSNGQKDKNVGFAKVEIKNGQCKILVNLKGVYTKNPENYGVFFAVRKDEKLLGIKIGDIAVKNGIGEYSSMTYPGNIHDSGYSFSDISGLFIGSKNNRNNVMASQWDDDEINTSNIIFPDEIQAAVEIKEEIKGTVQDSKENVEDVLKEEKVSETENIFEEVEVKETQNISQEVKTEPIEEVVASQDKQEEAVETFDEQEEKIEESESAQESVPELNTISLKNAQQEVSQQAAPAPIQYDWKSIFEKNRKIDAFSDDDFYECIEINPEDLKKMPLSDPNLCNNSFLMHGYYGYKHILFGKVQKNNEENLYFIGIPGVYSNREKFMSSMFGFNNFKKSHRGDYRNPYFGYWYIELYI